MSKPNILVLGGVGFIGRNFVQYLVENNLAGQIRVADKVLPPTAYLTPKQQAAFEKVEFKQGNLVNPSAIEKIFTDGDVQWDYVVNLAAETKYSQTDEVYEEKVYLLSVNCAKEAAKRKVKKFVELSTAQVYDADKKASKEDAKIKPWTLIAKYKLKAEEELKKISGLNLVILRPAIVYGPSDVAGLTPRLIMGAVYKELNEEMKLLWTKELRLNTVHVRDVARAIFHLFGKGANGSVYNLADKGDTDQEAVNTMVGNIFKIKTGFHGTIISNMVKLNLESATEEINDKHLQPWSDVCKKAGITNTPLTPYLDKELLYNNSLSVDGTAIESTGFSYEVPKLTEGALREALDGFIAINIFPKGLF